MMLSFPLPAAQFMDLLPIRSLTFDLPEQMHLSRTASGITIGADLGPRLWSGRIELGKMTEDEARPIRAMLNVLRGARRSFLIYDATRPWPLADPGGLLLGSATPQIRALGSGRQIALRGLPAGYRLGPGDLIGWHYGSDPVRHALHEVVGTALANGAGDTPLFEVSAEIRPGAALNAPVSLIRATCMAVILPESTATGTHAHTLTEGMGFDFQQTLV